ncbi:MAG TPA: extracellular solute-binding protein, partial [Gaiellaceae bacterium]|nr:extracellular solute-binding protein [Gaiellaceae bacterium]
MKKQVVIAATAAVVAAVAIVAGAATAPAQSTSLTIYSGREERLVKPIMDRFTRETGIQLNVRYASSTTLATALVEEGRNSPADVYWSQEPGTLGLVASRGLLDRLPTSVVGRVPPRFATPSRRWVGTSARSRVLVYNTRTVATRQLPASVWNLTAARWRGKLGIAPTNASFEAFVTGLRVLEGDDAARAWLEGMAANDVETFDNNIAVLDAVDNGVVSLGLINHYYWYERV